MDNQVLRDIQESLKRIEEKLDTTATKTEKNNEIASKLGEFIWVLEKIGGIVRTLQDQRPSFFLKDEAN